MTIIPFGSACKAELSRLLVPYFRELDSDIPDSIVSGKLTDLILQQCLSGVLHVDLLYCRGLCTGFSIYQVDTERSDWCKRPGWGFIREFYIHPGSRRCGLGKALAAHTVEALKELGAREFYLTAQPGCRFWERCGWTDTGSLCSNDLHIFEYT